MNRLIVVVFLCWMGGLNVLLASCGGNGEKSSESANHKSDVEDFNDSTDDDIPVGSAIKEEDYGKTNKESRTSREAHVAYNINVSEPVIVYEAEKVEKWGFVQFPRILKNAKGEVGVTWNMAEDNITAKPKVGWKYSKDEGKTWGFRWRERPIFPGTVIPNGDEIRFVTTKENVDKLKLPQARFSSQKETSKQRYRFYKSADIDQSHNTFALNRKKKGSDKFVQEKVVMEDPIGYRYDLAGLYFKQVWGDIVVGNNGELLKVNYPFYHAKNDELQLSGIAFYSSTDNGHSWKLKSYIEYNGDQSGRNVTGFQEPVMIKLRNGSFLTVMRSAIQGRSEEMYSSISTDNAASWSTPTPIAENGVLPQLLQLNNGVLILSYGRPGVQIKYSVDDGKTWSDTIDLVDKSEKGQSSCGYTGLLPIGDDEFLITYSNFNHRNSKGQKRKAIEVRRIKISND